MTGALDFAEMPGGLSFIGVGLYSQQSPSQGEPIESEVKRRKGSHVEGEQSAKNFGMLAKDLESTSLKPGPAIQREHQPRHQ